MLSPELLAVVDGCADGAALIDADHRLLHFNEAYVRLVGLSKRELKKRVSDGARCSDLLPLSVCKNACVGCRAQASEAPLRVDRVGLREPMTPTHSVAELTAEVQELQVSATPLDNGVVLETYRDTTAESRLHLRWREAIRKEREQNADLERQVAARTADLVRTNEELRRAQTSLVQQEKMSSLGLLVAGVAHELNNPINFIVCNLPFLADYVNALEQLVDTLESAISPSAHDAVDELRKALDLEYLRTDAPQLLQSVKNGANRAAAIVHDLRAFSHGGEEHDAPVDLVAGIETTLNLVKPLLEQRVRLSRELVPVDRLVGQPGQLNQVFMNLVANAIQAVLATPQRSGNVMIRTCAEDAHWARVEVMDEGIGIPEANRDRIFDPFFTTKPVGTGTGLGLAISYGIVERHGGTMTFTSEPGRGTTFVVRLPRRTPEHETAHDVPLFTESDLR